MWLVVGLGNPGARYEGTRHNVGFEVVERLVSRYRLSSPRESKSARHWRGKVRGHEVMLAKPLTFMNLSGDAVGALLRYYRLPLESLIVVHDELDFPPGQVRVKVGGGHGGHNGLVSIIGHVGADFARVRVGVGKPPAADRGADHVLARFGASDRKAIDAAIERAADAVEMALTDGIQAAMGRFNRKESGPEASGDS
ncbi:MAG: aminoacyl-tRNA hydrolase [Myxococcota bacterium]